MSNPYGAEAAKAAASALRSRLGSDPPDIALILGSGLGRIADEVSGARSVGFAEIPGFATASVAGHAGRIVAGELEGKKVLALAGRMHAYEGHSLPAVAYPSRVLRALGAPILFVSNAAGGVNRNLEPGDLMLIEDHLNLMFRSPLTGPLEPGDERFPDMSEPYDRPLRQLMETVAKAQKLPLKRGVYAALGGPAYETRAEVRMVERLGADAVGMSTVPEVTVARAIGMRVVGVSCITNHACGITDDPLSHAEVLETTARVADRFVALVRGFVAAL